jgi:hypothetical protein
MAGVKEEIIAAVRHTGSLAPRTSSSRSDPPSWSETWMHYLSQCGSATFELLKKGLRRERASPQRAPFRVHDVVQVVVTPWSHFLQTATHCSISFGLYEGYRSVAHFLRDPVASCSGEHEVVTTARASKAAKRRMKLRPADDPMLT